MSESWLITSLDLPSSARVDRRVAKKLLLDHCGPTAADRRLVQEGMEELVWVASLKPSNLGIESGSDAEVDFSEIAVLLADLRPLARVQRLVDLIHRAIPYPVLLGVRIGETESLSAACKRRAQDGKRETVVERVFLSEPLAAGRLTEASRAFVASLSLKQIPARTLKDLYQGWIDRLTALEAASLGDPFRPPASPVEAAALRDAVDQRRELTEQIEALRACAGRERQLTRRVELNAEIQRLEALRRGQAVVISRGAAESAERRAGQEHFDAGNRSP